MTSPTTPAGATEHQEKIKSVLAKIVMPTTTLDEQIALIEELEKEAWWEAIKTMQNEPMADIHPHMQSYLAAHEASAVLDGKIEVIENVIRWEEQWGDNPHADRMEAHRNALATLTKQKAAMQQEETA